MKKLIFTLLGVVTGFHCGKRLGIIRKERKEKQELKEEVFQENLKKREEIADKICDRFWEEVDSKELEDAFREAERTGKFTHLDNILFKYLEKL